MAAGSLEAEAITLTTFVHRLKKLRAAGSGSMSKPGSMRIKIQNHGSIVRSMLGRHPKAQGSFEAPWLHSQTQREHTGQKARKQVDCSDYDSQVSCNQRV
ncbi:hypothetical protein GOP47_0027394 [Adiantum capillus-veneris]|nr:hypothetical protein GOP47_0027394 [Adiantum capillus-veneris]